MAAFTLIQQKFIEKSIFLLTDSEPIDQITDQLYLIIEAVRDEIPEKKKISYGRYSIIKSLGQKIYSEIEDKEIPFKKGQKLFFQNSADSFVRSLGVQLITLYTIEKGALDLCLSIIEQAAGDEDWIVRECCSGFVRKLVRHFEKQMGRWYITMAESKNPMKRRFASESLRPVADNRWLKKHREFPFAVLEKLYFEHDAYPRTSVGNSLSDWMRVDQEYTLPIIRKLAQSGNKDSYWIAYRACRNLVKEEPLLVLDLLKIDEYVYKTRRVKREDL